MAQRVTRGAAAKEASLLASGEKSNLPARAPTTGKRKRGSAAPKKEEDPNELPHGLGKLWKPNATQPSEEGNNGPLRDREENVSKGDSKNGPVEENKPSTNSTAVEAGKELASATAKAKGKPPAQSREKRVVTKTYDAASVVDPTSVSAAAAASAKKSRKIKTNPYGLTPGVTPYPDWAHPTPEECQEVNDLLSSVHGHIAPPEKIPEPSLTVAGCGEVPCVLDALVRTYLSSSTSGENSNRAIQGIIEEYGLQTEGLGKGSVDWDAVRGSPVSRLFKAIESGGLAAMKSANIKKTLDMIYEENQVRRSALLAAAQETSSSKATAVAPAGAQTESAEAKALEIARAEENILSLDHLHSMPAQDAFFHMLRYPGIGVKTASCVSLFCLRHPSFAVDTHVFRHCQWLGWVPENATRDKTFMHCEVRIPEHLKYSLHQLFIQHGKKCGRCKARAGENSEGWQKGCPIDHLVKRTSKEKKGPVKKPNAKKREKSEESEDDGSGEGVKGDDGDKEGVVATPASKSKGKAPVLPRPERKTPAVKGKPKGKKGASADDEVEEEADAGGEEEPQGKKAKKEPSPVKKQPKKVITKGKKGRKK
ncbi:MAG: hypothetical protein Q9202_004226 [Teloschistes flavicans]